MQEVIAEILAPVLEKQKKESEYCAGVREELKDVHKVQDDHIADLKHLKRGFKQVQEFNR